MCIGIKLNKASVRKKLTREKCMCLYLGQLQRGIQIDRKMTTVRGRVAINKLRNKAKT